jgi:hypothetical protein
VFKDEDDGDSAEAVEDLDPVLGGGRCRRRHGRNSNSRSATEPGRREPHFLGEPRC